MSTDVRDKLIEKTENGIRSFWDFFWKNPAANLFDGFALPCVVLLATGITAQTFRNNSETAARTVLRIPFLHIRIENSHVMGVMFALVTLVVIIMAFNRLRNGVSDSRCPQFEYWFPIVSAVVLICTDCILTYLGVATQGSFFKIKKIEPIPAIMAVAWSAITVWLGYFHSVLRAKESES